VRSLGLTYTDDNALGSGSGASTDEGLTAFGFQVVRRMNDLGIIVDVSHAGDRTALNAIDASHRPAIISHTGARAVWAIDRNKPDTVIKACAAGGGVVGILAAPGTTLAGNPRRHDLDSVFAHFEHCVKLVGIEHVAFGPDTHFGDHVAWTQTFGTPEATAAVNGLEPPWVVGMENPNEAWWNILRHLVREGYNDREMRLVLGNNVRRIIDATWRT
jgi:membrane dipeptidase